MIILSFFTAQVDRTVLDRFYARMKTPVNPDPAKDRAEVELSYQKPDRFNHTKIFPGSQLEFCRWTSEDAWGFILGLVAAGVVIGLTLWVAGIGV